MACHDPAPSAVLPPVRLPRVSWLDAVLMGVMLVALVPVFWLATIVLTAPENTQLMPQSPTSGVVSEQESTQHTTDRRHAPLVERAEL